MKEEFYAECTKHWVFIQAFCTNPKSIYTIEIVKSRPSAINTLAYIILLTTQNTLAINYAFPGKLTSLSYNLNFKIWKLTKEEKKKDKKLVSVYNGIETVCL